MHNAMNPRLESFAASFFFFFKCSIRARKQRLTSLHKRLGQAFVPLVSWT